MDKRVFVAGASSAVGRPLCTLLRDRGWQVTGSTRSPHKLAALAALDIEPVLVDVFDADRLAAVVREAHPTAVIHQLTDLPDALDPVLMPEALLRNARIRETGTRHLLAAALAAGAGRLIAQSIAFAYAPGPLPYAEDAPLNAAVAGPAGATPRGLAALESQVLGAPLLGIVLRYGKFYGPDTGFERPSPGGGSVHVDAAALAAALALERGAGGVYNVVEDEGTVDSRKARTQLGWDPAFRLPR